MPPLPLVRIKPFVQNPARPGHGAASGPIFAATAFAPRILPRRAYGPAGSPRAPRGAEQCAGLPESRLCLRPVAPPPAGNAPCPEVHKPPSGVGSWSGGGKQDGSPLPPPCPFLESPGPAGSWLPAAPGRGGEPAGMTHAPHDPAAAGMARLPWAWPARAILGRSADLPPRGGRKGDGPLETRFCPPPAASRAWVAANGARAFCAPGRFLGTGAMACGAPCAKDRLYLAAWNGRDAGIWILRASRREKSTWHPCGPQQTILISHRPRRPRVNVAGHSQPLAAAMSAVAPAPFTGHCGTPVPHTARDHGAPSAARGPREPPAAGRAGGE